MSEDSDSEENNINNVESQPRPSEEKNALSKSAINQLVKSVVAESKKSSNSESTPRITNEARDALATYGAIFIRQITDKALTHSMKKTMTSGNVFSALKDSGFADLAQECRGIAEKSKTAREDNRKRKKSKKLESLGISEEELLRQQEALFEKARKEMELEDEEVMKYQHELESMNLQPTPAKHKPQTAEVDEEDFDI